MANTKISALPAGVVAGAIVLAGVAGGVTSKFTASDLASYSNGAGRAAPDCTVAYADGTETIDASAGGKCRLTNDLDGNTTLTFSNAATGLDGRVAVRQNAVGGFTLDAAFTGATTVFLGGSIDADADAYGYLGWDCATVDSNLTCFYWLAPEEASAGSSTTVQAAVPIETDDSGDGYAIGDRVCSSVINVCYTAIDVTVGAAVWRRDTAHYNEAIQAIGPFTGNAVDDTGLVTASAGTLSTPALANTNLRTSMKRTNAADPAGGSIRTSEEYWWLGDAAGLGGFDVEFTYAMSTAASGQMHLCGLFDGTPDTPKDPETEISGVWIGNGAADTNSRIMHNDATGAPTEVDLGASFPAVSATPVVYVHLYAGKNASAVYYVVRRLDTAAVAAGNVSTNLPANTAFLRFYCGSADLSGDSVGVDLMQFRARFLL